MPTQEDIVTNAVCEYLEVKGYFFWKTYNGGIYDPSRKLYRKPPKWSMKGVSDIILICGGEALFIEVKSKTGQQDKEQKEFQKRVEENGGYYYIVRSIDDIQEIGL